MLSNKCCTSTLNSGNETEISPEAIINAYYFQAMDELVNRILKDFGIEHLPFKHFASNAAFYYLMCIPFFLFASFKYDMDSPAIKITWYAETFRRKVFDFAGQIIRSGRRIFLKLPEVIAKALYFRKLWDKSGSIPRLEPLPVSFRLFGTRHNPCSNGVGYGRSRRSPERAYTTKKRATLPVETMYKPDLTL